MSVYLYMCMYVCVCVQVEGDGSASKLVSMMTLLSRAPWRMSEEPYDMSEEPYDMSKEPCDMTHSYGALWKRAKWLVHEYLCVYMYVDACACVCARMCADGGRWQCSNVSIHDDHVVARAVAVERHHLPRHAQVRTRPRGCHKVSPPLFFSPTMFFFDHKNVVTRAVAVETHFLPRRAEVCAQPRGCNQMFIFMGE